jgi:hypothetical protein
MYQWRISKFNPIYRDEKGAYQRDDWTSASDIGHVFDGKELSLDDYLRTEDRYIQAITAFAQESDLSYFEVVDLDIDIDNMSKHINNELSHIAKDLEIFNGKYINIDEIDKICRLVLRDLIWCKLEITNEFYVHFGYDYYAFVGSIHPCTQAIHMAQDLGLFIEQVKTPFGFEIVGA